MADLKAHVFICTNVKEGRESCGPKGAADLRDVLKKMSKDERLLTSLHHAISIAYGGKTKANCRFCRVVMELPIIPFLPVVVASCGKCNNYVLPFAGLLLPLHKNVIDSGQDVDRRFEITQAIMKALHELVQRLFQLKNNKVDVSDIPESLEDLEKIWNKN